MAEFEMDFNKITKAMMKSPHAVGKGATKAMKEIKDDWVRESRDLAPIEFSNLRTQISGRVGRENQAPYVEVESNAFADTGGKRFNYAYYIHEGYMRDSGKSLRSVGTVEDYLEQSIENRHKDYEKWLTEEIKSALESEGW